MRHFKHILPIIISCILLSVTASLLITISAHARENISAIAVPANRSSFTESYDPFPDVSGSFLVGLRIGDVSDKLNVNDVTIALPSDPSKSLCISSTTQDGRYSSENNPYTISSPVKNANSVRLAPFTLKYYKNLKEYQATALAVRAYHSSSHDCNPKDALNLPQLSIGPDKTNTLYVMINAESRQASAKLTIDKGPVSGRTGNSLTHTACTQIRDRACIAFDTICELSLHEIPKETEALLELVLNDGFGEETHSFHLFLPQL